MDRLETHSRWFAQLITANARIPATDTRLVDAFTSTPREQFVGPGPWRVFVFSGYIETPSDDPALLPALLYQDTIIALKTGLQAYGINNGQPTLHAACLAALGVKEGEVVVHVGAGTGYYTAILAKLTGPTGSVFAYEIDEELAGKAARNLAEYPHVHVHTRSGSEGPLPSCDIVYVNAGATDPLDVWLDALRPGGRLLFPLTPPLDSAALHRVRRVGAQAAGGGCLRDPLFGAIR